ncbi:MAG: ferritin [Candidatus Schekmanbacteria bacterium]|nr:MAG: ferritin [Candidatus Schekmanbacteria bacterium]
MISKKMAKALNDHLNKEIYSAYLYLSMQAYSENAGLKGFANWFNVQVQEELFHAQKVYKYILDQGERVILEEIEKPESNFKSPADLFNKTLEHEKAVTARINKLVDLAKKENDHATEGMLQWFVSEQVEEETSVNDIIQQLKLIGKDGSGLFMLDRELGQRTFTAPAE